MRRYLDYLSRFARSALATRRARWAVGVGVVAVVLLACDWLFPLPAPGRASPYALTVVARDGSPLRAFPDRDHVWRHPITLDQVSPLYVEALTGYEDRFFWWHPGVNPFALARAAWQRLRHGRIVSGGSTLTMQVARIIDPTPRTPVGKLRQIARALQLELHYSKQEILTLYLNYVPMGGVLEGVEAASRGYFGKSSGQLSHAEAALLAVLPQAPSRLRPDRYPHVARAARDKLLHRVAPRWDTAAIEDALSEPVIVQTLRDPKTAPLLAERMRKNSRRQLRIDTTIDVSTQMMTETLLTDRARALPPRVSMAALVMDNATLEVLAYVGSADFSDPERFSHVDMIRASRSPGSTLKPFLYAFALDEGLIHSESLLADVPQDFGGYEPGNFQQSFHGPVSVSEALVKSLNVPAVHVLDELGPTRFVALLRQGGLKLDLPRGASPNLSVILGGAGATLEELVGAYSSLARRGLAGTPRFTPNAPLSERRMMSEGAAYIVRDILESGGPSARAINTSDGPQRGIAWKTGTSFGFRDAWAIGVSNRYTVGVWVGRPDGTPNPGFFGANVAAPLLVDVFSLLPESGRTAPRTPPTGVAQEKICWPLGGRYAADSASLCHAQRHAWTLTGVAPPTFPDRLRPGSPRQTYMVDAGSGLRVLPDCAAGATRTVEAARWPTLLEPWLDADLRQRATPPEWSPRCRGHVQQSASIKIVGLNHGTVVQQANGAKPPVVRLDVRGQEAPVYWIVNGRVVAHGAGSQVLQFDAPGRYDITALDQEGRFDRISVSVRPSGLKSDKKKPGS